MGQLVYVKKIITNLNITNSHAVGVLINFNCKLNFCWLKYNPIPEFQQFYQLIAGLLIFLMLCIQPNLLLAMLSITNYVVKFLKTKQLSVYYSIRPAINCCWFIEIYLHNHQDAQNSDWVGNIVIKYFIAGYVFNMKNVAIN